MSGSKSSNDADSIVSHKRKGKVEKTQCFIPPKIQHAEGQSISQLALTASSIRTVSLEGVERPRKFQKISGSQELTARAAPAETLPLKSKNGEVCQNLQPIPQPTSNLAQPQAVSAKYVETLPQWRLCLWNYERLPPIQPVPVHLEYNHFKIIEPHSQYRPQPVLGGCVRLTAAEGSVVMPFDTNFKSMMSLGILPLRFRGLLEGQHLHKLQCLKESFNGRHEWKSYKRDGCQSTTSPDDFHDRRPACLPTYEDDLNEDSMAPIKLPLELMRRFEKAGHPSGRKDQEENTEIKVDQPLYHKMTP